jgi:hypothetical protein
MIQWLRDIRQAFNVGLTRYRNLRWKAKQRAKIKDPFGA